jgi:hypothetical protein
MAYDNAWWQTLLQIAINVLLIGGCLGLLGSLFYWFRGRPYRRHPGQMAILSLLALGLGALALLLARDLLLPQRVAI